MITARQTDNITELIDLFRQAEAGETFARRQLRFITDCRKQWVRDRAKFLGQSIQPGVLLNDEVNGDRQQRLDVG
ncbi:MAG: hypothetical protein ACLFVU_10170 [Phycisphaerae bacterium]